MSTTELCQADDESHDHMDSEIEEKNELSIPQLLYKGFQFAIMLSCLIATIIGFYILLTTYSFKCLFIGFGIFWLIWLISLVCDMIYERAILEPFRSQRNSEPVYIPPKKDFDYLAQHNRVCDELPYTRPTLYKVGYGRKRCKRPEVDPQIEKLEKLLLQAKSKQNQLELERLSRDVQASRCGIGNNSRSSKFQDNCRRERDCDLDSSSSSSRSREDENTNNCQRPQDEYDKVCPDRIEMDRYFVNTLQAQALQKIRMQNTNTGVIKRICPYIVRD